jgi:uncharacterized protein YqeY
MGSKSESKSGPKPDHDVQPATSARPERGSAKTELEERLNADLKAAMKARESDRVGVIRLVLSELNYARIDKGRELTGEDVIQVLKRGLKSRGESIDQFKKGGREDLAQKEEREVEILRAYLPEPLTGQALAAIVDAAIQKAGGTTAKDMGAVMKLVLGEHGARVDGKEVQSLVRARLGS